MEIHLTTNQLLLIASCVLGLAVAWFLYTVGPAWDQFANWKIAQLRPRLQALRLDDEEKLRLYLRLWGGAMLITLIVLGFYLQMIPIALACMYLLYVMPHILIHWAIEHRQTLLRDQMVGASITMANACRAGLALAQGLQTVAEEAPEPLATEFHRIVYQYESGLTLKETLVEAKERLDLDSFTLFVSAVLVCLERGGRITEALERISESLQENQRLERKLDSATAAGRKVMVVLAVFPVGFLGLFYLIFPEGTGMLFTTILGQVVLTAVIGIVYLSIRWSQRIMAIEI
ncbi:Hypothetical protein PBC10988_23820 [Planctomycetales bacterium 10988]|nr:Hypothetical protein PBC10988_23820 [Planctomycetales bacterium 10988]